MNEFVKVEVSELVEPRGKLAEILQYIEGLPMTVPKSVVGLIARLAFSGAYTAVSNDLTELNTDMIQELSQHMGEMHEFSVATEVKVKEDIQKILEGLTAAGRN